MTELFKAFEDHIPEIIEIGTEAKKESNKKEAFSKLWRDEFAPSNHIGHTNKLLLKYGSLKVIGDFTKKTHVFIIDYLYDPDPTFNYEKISGSIHHGRNQQQVETIARQLSKRCTELGITFDSGLENDIERLMCLVINHACVETINGKYCEVIVEEYFNRFGFYRKNFTDEADSTWDTNGVDILLYKDDLLFRFVQVKPISFILGNKPDLIEDRKKCFTNNQPFVNEYLQMHFKEAHPNIKPDIIYCFYNKDNHLINFQDRTDDRGVFVNFVDVCNEDGTAKYDSRTLKKLKQVDLITFNKTF